LPPGVLLESGVGAVWVEQLEFGDVWFVESADGGTYGSELVVDPGSSDGCVLESLKDTGCEVGSS